MNYLIMLYHKYIIITNVNNAITDYSYNDIEKCRDFLLMYLKINQVYYLDAMKL